MKFGESVLKIMLGRAIRVSSQQTHLKSDRISRLILRLVPGDLIETTFEFDVLVQIKNRLILVVLEKSRKEYLIP